MLADGSMVVLKYYSSEHVPGLTEEVAAADVVEIDQICECCYVDVTWTLECVSSIDGSITVTALTSGGKFLDDDSTYIDQQWKAHLVAGVSAFPGYLNVDDANNDTFVTFANDTFGIGQDFTVVVVVTNIGEATATDVVATINVSGSASPSGVIELPIGTIGGGQSGKAWITLTCTGEGDVTISNPDNPLRAVKIEGNDANTGVSVLADNINTPCAITVHQAVCDFTVEIIQPHTCQWFDVCQYYTVKALVKNNGDTKISNVTATVYYTETTAELPMYERQIRNLGDIPAGRTFEVCWVLHCINPGDVDITVVAESASLSAISNTVTVHQQGPTELTINIVSPAAMDLAVVGMPDIVLPLTFIATSQEFAVTAMVYNPGGSVAENVVASIETFTLTTFGDMNGDGYIDFDDLMLFLESPEVLDSMVKPLGDIAPGEFKSVTWTLHCDMPGGSFIGVTALADNVEEPAVDYISLVQYPAAHLEVNITDYPATDITVGQDFDVRAVITNTGWADAWEVSATLSVEPEGSVRVAAGDGGYTQYIGTLAGWGNETQNSAEVTWHLNCKQACNSTITVTAQGYDELGLEFRMELGLSMGAETNVEQLLNLFYVVPGYVDWPEVYVWFEVNMPGLIVFDPGAEIPGKFIEPDSITVKQVGPAAPANLEVIDVVAPEQVYVGSDYQVVVVVGNTGGTDATGVQATIAISAGASTTESLTKTLGTIAAGNQVTVGWTLRCDGKSGVGISVTVGGAVGAATVQQTVDPDDLISYLDVICASLVGIDGNIATLSTYVGEMKVSLADINASIVEVKDGLVTLNTTLGTITTSLDSINASIVEVKDGLVTLNTTLGTITTSLDSINASIVEVKDGVATVNTTLGTIHTDLANLELVVPDEVNVSPWTWLWAPILVGFIILGIIIFFALRKLGVDLKAKKEEGGSES